MENSIINYDHENFSDSNEEKIFNLQLLVTKLEEEISYYRNGTSAEQFMEIIHERDNEIKDLKHEIYILNEEKVIQSEKLKEIVLKSSEVLEKYESLLLKTDESDVLHDENNRLKRQVDEALTINEDLQEDLSRMKKQMIENAVVNASLQDEISRLKRQIVENSSSNTALRDENHRLKAEIDGNSALHKSMIAENKSLRQLNDDNMITITNHQNEIQKLNNLIEELQHNTVLQHDYDHLIIELNSLRSQQEDSEHYHHEIQERDSNIEKLQQRCACLVSEKSELKKLFEKEKSDRIKQGKEFRDEIEKAIKFNNEIKVKYHNEHQRVLELHQQVKELQRDYDNQKQLLLDCQCSLDSSIKKHNTMMENMTQQLAEYERQCHDMKMNLHHAYDHNHDLETEFQFQIEQKDNKIADLYELITNTEKDHKNFQRQQQQEANLMITSLRNDIQDMTHQYEVIKNQYETQRNDYDQLKIKMKELEKIIHSHDRKVVPMVPDQSVVGRYDGTTNYQPPKYSRQQQPGSIGIDYGLRYSSIDADHNNHFSPSTLTSSNSSRSSHHSELRHEHEVHRNVPFSCTHHVDSGSTSGLSGSFGDNVMDTGGARDSSSERNNRSLTTKQNNTSTNRNHSIKTTDPLSKYNVINTIHTEALSSSLAEPLPRSHSNGSNDDKENANGRSYRSFHHTKIIPFSPTNPYYDPDSMNNIKSKSESTSTYLQDYRSYLQQKQHSKR